MPLTVTVQRTNGQGVTWALGLVPPGIPVYPIVVGDGETQGKAKSSSSRSSGPPPTAPTVVLIQVDVWVIWKTAELALGTGSNVSGTPATPSNGAAGAVYPQDPRKTGTCWQIDDLSGNSPNLVVIVDCLSSGAHTVEVLVVGRNVAPPRLPPAVPSDFDYHADNINCP